MSKHIQRCHPDQLLDLTFVDKSGIEPSRPLCLTPPPVTTLDVILELPKCLDVSVGIGKAKGSVNTRRAERVRLDPPKAKLPCIGEGDESSGEDYDDEEEDCDEDDGDGEKPMIMAVESRTNFKGVNGHGKSVQFIPQSVADSGATDDDEPRTEQTRQHLLLLAESSQGFIRHQGLHEGGEWVVDFQPLVAKLRRSEVDSFIEDKFTRQGLRLVNILRQRGKMDDKSLLAIAQMKKPDALHILSKMELYGVVDIQEVPRDNNRQAIRTIFLWHVDDDRVQAQILENSFKSMLRCLQVLDVQRYRNRETLELFQRSDVKGREEERLHKQTIAKYRQHLKMVANLLNQVMRVDDMVCLLWDF